MKISHWVERLRTRVDDLDVHGAAELAAIQGDHRRDAAYVIPLSETAAGRESIDTDRQVVTVRLGVVLAISNARDPRGGDAYDEIRTARQPVIDALLGWTPPDGWGPALYAGGRLLRFAGRVAWWQDEFECDFLRGTGAGAAEAAPREAA